MAQWLGAYAGNTHESKVAEVEHSLRLVVASFKAGKELEKVPRMLAVSRLAHRLYRARLKAFEAKISRDSEPRPGGVPDEGLIRHRRRLETLLTSGVDGILNEFDVPELAVTPPAS